MSLQTWLEEFYPCEARTDEAKADPAGHSLRKWIGFLPENLKRHDVVDADNHIVDDVPNNESLDRFRPSGANCALCEVHYGQKKDPEGSHVQFQKWLVTAPPYQYGNREHIWECWECPLAIVRDHVPCDTTKPDVELRSPFAAWVAGDGPVLMVNWLRKAVDYARSKLA